MARPGVNAAVAITAPQLVFMGGASIALSEGGAGLSGGAAALREAAIRAIQHLAELVQAGQTVQAQIYIRALAGTAAGQALLRAMEEQLDASLSQMGNSFGSPQAFSLFQDLRP